MNTATGEIIGETSCAFDADTRLMQGAWQAGARHLAVVDTHLGTLLDLSAVPVAHAASSYGADLFMLVRCGELTLDAARARLLAAFPELSGDAFHVDDQLTVTLR